MVVILGNRSGCIFYLHYLCFTRLKIFLKKFCSKCCKKNTENQEPLLPQPNQHWSVLYEGAWGQGEAHGEDWLDERLTHQGHTEVQQRVSYLHSA